MQPMCMQSGISVLLFLFRCFLWMVTLVHVCFFQGRGRVEGTARAKRCAAGHGGGLHSRSWRLGEKITKIRSFFFNRVCTNYFSTRPHL